MVDDERDDLPGAGDDPDGTPAAPARSERARSGRAPRPFHRPSRALRVDATDLEGWANRRDAQSMLPQLVRRLAFATTDRSGPITFGAGEAVQQAGWDGITELRTGTSFVPAGMVGWELGTGSDVSRKANADYASRTADPLTIDPATSTFIFVTLRRWPEKVAWASRRRAEGIWRDVRVYDADDLETWLELAHSVHLWLSAALGKKPDGAMDLATYVSDWLEATKPPLSTDLLVAGRSHSAAAICEWLQGPSSCLGLQAETREEAIAFFACVLDRFPTGEREAWESRGVVVLTESAWQELTLSRDPLILFPQFTPASTARAERNGHRIVLASSSGQTGGREDVVVGPIERREAERALERSGMTTNEARDAAWLARRSMIAFRRVHGRGAEPAWAAPENGRALAQVMLVGEWDESREGDRDVASRVAGVPYDALLEQCIRWSSGSDAPVRHVGRRWFLVSREDAWRLLARYLTADDLRRFQRIAIEVLSTPDPRFDLPLEKQWMANVLGHSHSYSPSLVKAIATTLAQLGAHGGVTRRTAAVSGEAIAAVTVRAALHAANTDHRIWASLSSVLPLLAEAAPDPFLDAVDSGLHGTSPPLRHMFTDAPGASSGWLSSSPHTGLLWALERLAWSPDYLGRAAAALARLSVLDDPRGTLMNRPDRSLRTIFHSLRPQTSTALPKRLDTLDRLRKAHADVAWDLMLALLPTGFDMLWAHSPAEWRRWGEEPPETGFPE